MAPKVRVPADFGRRHLGSPSHGNLTFTTLQEPVIKANSIILSLNSPVIDHLTTDLHLTLLEADDFSREAVDCFIESCYTGEIEAVTPSNFRDVNKMSHVFQVTWLSARCESYFTEYITRLDDQSSYSDVLFAVEEAVYALRVAKKRNFLDLIGRKTSFSVEKLFSFMGLYLADFPSCSTAKLDVCITLVKSDVHVLLEVLLSHLEQSGARLDSNSRYLLRNLDLNACQREHPETHGRLYSVLENLTEVTREDVQLFLSLSKVSSSRLKTREVRSISQSMKLVQNRSIKPLLEARDLDTLYDQLTSDETIDNLYVFFDAIWFWLVMNKSSAIPLTFFEKIVHAKEEYGWSEIDKEYLRNLVFCNSANTFVEEMKACDGLVKVDDMGWPVVLFEYSCGGAFVRNFFCKDNIFKFKLPGELFSGMEFIMISSSGKGNQPFTARWGLYRADGDPGPLPRLHFALRHEYQQCDDARENWQIIPITCCGVPTCDTTRNLWNWGNVKFHTKNMRELRGSMLVEGEGLVKWTDYLEVTTQKIQLVCFLVDYS